MRWQALLTSQRIRAHTTSRQELDDLRTVVERDLADAAIAVLSAGRRFATAYNAALQTATMAIACAGYRTSGLGHHQTTFEAAELARVTTRASLAVCFDTWRRKRKRRKYSSGQRSSWC